MVLQVINSLKRVTLKNQHVTWMSYVCAWKYMSEYACVWVGVYNFYLGVRIAIPSNVTTASSPPAPTSALCTIRSRKT